MRLYRQDYKHRVLQIYKNNRFYYSLKKYYLLQVNDSLFPIGGYSHSQGLETYIQKGLVYDLKTAEKYIENKINMSFKYTDLLAVKLAYERAAKDDVKGLVELEDILFQLYI